MKLYQKLVVATVGVTLSLGMIEASLARPTTAATLKYQIIDLGNLGGSDGTYAYGINDLGQVVGTSSLFDNGTTHAFRTQPNQPIDPTKDDLGTGGYNGSFGVYGNGINNQGQVIGRAYPNGWTINAFRTTRPDQPINKATDDLGSLGGDQTDAVAINNSGQIAGDTFTTGDKLQHAIRIDPGQQMTPANDLGTLDKLNPSRFGNFSIAKGINDLGQVVGVSTITDPRNISGIAYRAFRTAPNQPINPTTDNLGSLGGDSEATDINNLGQVVGDSYLDNSQTIRHAFRTEPGKPITHADDLGTLEGSSDSDAYGINNSGVVVGTSLIPGGTQNYPIYHAFVYDDSMHDLNNLAVSLGDFSYLDTAYDINASGEIVGSGILKALGSDGRTREGAFLAIPFNESPQSVPEPSNSIISSLAILGLGWLFKRKGKV